MHNLFARTGSFDFKRSRYLIHVKSGRQQCAPRRMAFSIFEQMLGVGHKEGGGADSRSRSFFRSPRRTILSLFIRGRWRGNFRSPSLSLSLSLALSLPLNDHARPKVGWAAAKLSKIRSVQIFGSQVVLCWWCDEHEIYGTLQGHYH